MPVPAGMDQDGFTAHIPILKNIRRYRPGCGVCPKYQAVKIGHRIQNKLRQIPAVGIAMKRRINISPGVGHHFDFADLKGCSIRIMALGRFAAQMIGDLRPRQGLDT